MPNIETTFLNLLDQIIEFEENSELKNNCELQFKELLKKFYFVEEAQNSKSLTLFLGNLELPEQISKAKNLISIDITVLNEVLNGTTTNDSFCGKIMLSKEYLKNVYPQHTPTFKNLPSDVQAELFQKIKERNLMIFDSFEKMKSDINADKERKIITLIALVLKNIHYKSGFQLKELSGTASDVITKCFPHSQDIFDGSDNQVREIKNDGSIKDLLKIFFLIKKFNEITDLTEQYKKEVDRFIKRRNFLKDQSGDI